MGRSRMPARAPGATDEVVADEVEFRELRLLRKVQLVGVRDADLASVDREHFGGVFFSHKNRLHLFDWSLIDRLLGMGRYCLQSSESRLRAVRLIVALLLAETAAPVWSAVHVWEKQEVTLVASHDAANPYTDVTVWVDLDRPRLQEARLRILGRRPNFRVRLVATAPGKWTWRSGSNPADPGLAGKTRWIHRRSPGPRRRSSRTRCAAASCAPPPISTRWSRPTARRSS